MTLRDQYGNEATESDVLGYVEVEMGKGEKGFVCDKPGYAFMYESSNARYYSVNYNVQLKICRDLGFEGV